MRDDLAGVDENRVHQLALDKQYTALNEWLATPDSMPRESVAEEMNSIFLANRTLYPRRSAWTTMVAAGQLNKLDSPALVARLADL